MGIKDTLQTLFSQTLEQLGRPVLSLDLVLQADHVQFLMSGITHFPSDSTGTTFYFERKTSYPNIHSEYPVPLIVLSLTCDHKDHHTDYVRAELFDDMADLIRSQNKANAVNIVVAKHADGSLTLSRVVYTGEHALQDDNIPMDEVRRTVFEFVKDSSPETYARLEKISRPRNTPNARPG